MNFAPWYLLTGSKKTFKFFFMSLSLEEKSELESILGSNLSTLPNPQNIQDVYQLFTNTMTRLVDEDEIERATSLQFILLFFGFDVFIRRS